MSLPAYFFPAEWQPHKATWIAWPHNRRDWPGKLEPVTWVYTEMVRLLSKSEPVRILVNNQAMHDRAQSMLRQVTHNTNNVELITIRTNRSWIRDYGPLVVKKNGEKVIVDFHFNAWVKYHDWKLDSQVAREAARHLNLPLVQADWDGRRVVLEGGAVDVNGTGTLITTEECLLDQQTQPRNPGFTREQTEAFLKHYFGVEQVIWLGKGIAGDDTHGHVDDLCRFVNPSTVVLCREENPSDENYRSLQENAERLQNYRLANGEKLTVAPLPMPQPIYFDGVRLPASYANFYITNRSVLVPTFNELNDRLALAILSELFPDREVIGVYCGDLIWGFGALHCLTQQEPA